MGIPGLLKEIGKGERVALAKLAFDHFEKTKRPLRIAIDAAIWNFQHQSAQGGKNPDLRTLFFRLLKLLALPIHPIFVYDGKNKPLTKRGRTVTRYGTCVPNEHSKSLVARFQFPHHTAPGEAEAECATLQKHGIVDAVMSQDVDAIMFGSNLTLRDWSKEGTKSNKGPTHVNVLDSSKIKALLGLDDAGMILVAMLSGGDYHEGIPGFGSTLSCSAAKAGFGNELIELVLKDDEQGINEWRQRLQYELETNESGYFSKKNKTVQIPGDFPNRKILDFYLRPAVTKPEDLKKLEAKWIDWWAKDIDVEELRQYTSITFDWMYKGGARKLIRCLAQPLFQHRLKTCKIDFTKYSGKDITERRQHFVSDGVPELRFSAVPGEVVGIDLEGEEENPDSAEFDADNGQDDMELLDGATKEVTEAAEPSSLQKRRKRPPWQPDIIEKWWIPEALLNLGLPSVVEEWSEEQKAIQSDPVKFATRKCRQPASSSKYIDANMKQGALKQYLPINARGKTSLAHQTNPSSRSITHPSVKPRGRNAADTVSYSQSMDNVFPSTKSAYDASTTEELDRTTAQIGRSPPTKSSTIFVEDVSPKRSRANNPANEDRLSEAANPVPASVTQRKRHVPRQPKQRTNLQEEDDEVIFVGESKAPRSIASFFGRKSSNINSAFNSRCAVPREAVAPLMLDETVLDKIGKALPQSENTIIEESAILSIREETVLKKKKALNAISRDSLPGAWKELSSTPNPKSRVSLIDLTND